MSDQKVAAVIIMAAGLGTRMKSARPKVLHEVGGRSMIQHAIAAANALKPERLVVVLGHQRESVEAHLREVAPHVTIAVQEEMLGTGDAVRAGLAAFDQIDGDVVVTSGDVPLLQGQTLLDLLAAQRNSDNQATVLTASVPEPSGYGRVVTDGTQVIRIVEQKDASIVEREIAEINAGIYVFNAAVLREQIAQLDTGNVQGEYYLTDVIAGINAAGGSVGRHRLDDYLQTEGVNDRIQLAARNAEYNARILRHWMSQGVTIIDPATTWIQADVDLAPDVTLLPGTSLEGATSIASGAIIGPDTTLIDVEVGEGANVTRTHGSLAVIAAEANVGPFSFLRPGTIVGEKAKIGAFVEAKNAQVGAGAKVPHLTYCGDAIIGEGSNIGAGTIFANYDGVHKYQTQVGAHSFVGSDSVLVAPVEIADGAYVAAGSVITGAVGAGELAVARGKQRNIPGWVERKRAGTASADAAKSVADDSADAAQLAE